MKYDREKMIELLTAGTVLKPKKQTVYIIEKYGDKKGGEVMSDMEEEINEKVEEIVASLKPKKLGNLFALLDVLQEVDKVTRSIVKSLEKMEKMGKRGVFMTPEQFAKAETGDVVGVVYDPDNHLVKPPREEDE